MATVAPPLRIGPADHGRMMTLDEFGRPRSWTGIARASPGSARGDRGAEWFSWRGRL